MTRESDNLSREISKAVTDLAFETMRKLSEIMVKADALYPDAPETAVNRTLIAFLYAILRCHLDACETIPARAR